MRKEKILIVEDETDIREILAYNLDKEGYLVLTAPDGEKGLDLVEKEIPDLVLLDLMLPGLDGLDVCRRMREIPSTKNIPIIMVTAKGEESDIVLGLGLGADDYVKKPFSPKELIGRVKAVLRRGRPKDLDATKKIVIRELEIDPTKHEVRLKGKNISFTLTEFRLLHHLASNPGRVFSRDRLLNIAVGEKKFVVDRNVDVHVRTIRKKLEDLDYMIETVRGVGYRFFDEEN
jgi:two-component system phosphate regulon response regulator PhoB